MESLRYPCDSPEGRRSGKSQELISRTDAARDERKVPVTMRAVPAVSVRPVCSFITVVL